MKKRTRWITVLLVFVAIIVIYVVVHTEEKNRPIVAPTVSGSIKNFASRSFSVSYPAIFTLEGYDTKSGTQTISFTDGDPSKPQHKYNILYTVYIKPGIADNQVLLPYMTNFIKTISGANPAVTQKTAQVDGNTALQFSYNAPTKDLPNNIVYITATTNNGTAYIIQQDNGNTSDYMKFVSSFRF